MDVRGRGPTNKRREVEAKSKMRKEERKLGREKVSAEISQARKGGGGETRVKLTSAASRWRC